MLTDASLLLPLSRAAGRLQDQDAAALLAAELDDTEPDVLTRPAVAAAAVADGGRHGGVSRHQSTSGGRDTPDSDGFGFSEFEREMGIEPLVPPELAQQAALEEAAVAADRKSVV